MGFFLMEKPWTEGAGDGTAQGSALSAPAATVGLGMFLGVVTVLFSLLSVAYVERMEMGDWRSLPEPWVLWPNTALLLLSSAAMQWARVGAVRGRAGDVRLGLLAGGASAFAFLAGQLVAWQQLADAGYYAAANPANGFFYLITALHGLHLAGGLVAWGRTTAKVRRGAAAEQVRASVDLCTRYWHFLLLVWLVLFGLLLFT